MMCEMCRYKAKGEGKIKVMAKGAPGLKDGEGAGLVIVECELRQGKEAFARGL